MEAVKSSAQANSLVKFLEQREVNLLVALQETRKQCGKKRFTWRKYTLTMFILKLLMVFRLIYALNHHVHHAHFFTSGFALEHKCKELRNIIDEQNSIIHVLKGEYTVLIQNFQECLKENQEVSSKCTRSYTKYLPAFNN